MGVLKTFEAKLLKIASTWFNRGLLPFFCRTQWDATLFNLLNINKIREDKKDALVSHFQDKKCPFCLSLIRCISACCNYICPSVSFSKCHKTSHSVPYRAFLPILNKKKSDTIGFCMYTIKIELLKEFISFNY